MKPVKIDWDALDEAFNNQNEELVYYLDLVTGHVVLEGEGEEDPYPEDDENLEPVAAAVVSTRPDSTRVYVDSPDDEQKLEWMRHFVEEGRGLERGILSALKAALAEDEPVAAVREVLNQNPDVRDRWYLYRSERVHEMIERWIEAHAIASTAPPPWQT